MREWRDIVAAFSDLSAAGKPCALATVVAVEGSAYRRSGARMLVAEDGRTWGGVSGGCLERDVADRARGVIATGRPFLHRYDTADDELIQRGVSTGCGGTIDVLLQPLSADSAGPIPQLSKLIADRPTPQTLITIIRASGRFSDLAGFTFDLQNDAALFQEMMASADMPDSSRAVSNLLVREANGQAKLLVERVRPPQRLVIVGGGPDAVPVVSIAKTLGWRVVVVAARPALGIDSRFADADERHVTGSESPLAGVNVSADCSVVVMTHNLARDSAVLAALPVRPRYLGLLGPRHRTERVLASLPPGHAGRSLHSPVGLDIGSESPEEIALSIVAEIQACVRAADARPLHVRPVRDLLPATDPACPR